MDTEGMRGFVATAAATVVVCALGAGLLAATASNSVTRLYGAPGAQFVAAFPSRPAEVTRGTQLRTVRQFISGNVHSTRVLVVDVALLRATDDRHFASTYRRDVALGTHSLGIAPRTFMVTASGGFIRTDQIRHERASDTTAVGGFDFVANRSSWTEILYLVGPRTAFVALAIGPSLSATQSLANSVVPLSN